MKKLVLGNGYIGSAFKDAQYDSIDKNEFDCNYLSLDHIIPRLNEYDVIVNAIGKTDTRWSEIPENFKELWTVNAEFVKNLSSYCNKNNKKLIHLSTGDLYGNNFDLKQTVEDSTRIDVGTNYRFSKYAAEKFCSPNDLILRIRLPFDGRQHPKNLLCKIPNFTKFYVYLNDYTYVPDIIKFVDIALEKDLKGIFNLTSHEDGSVVYILRKLLFLEKFMGDEYDLHNKKSPNLIYELSNIHVHNIMNDDKLRMWFTQTPLQKSVLYSWISLQKSQSVI